MVVRNRVMRVNDERRGRRDRRRGERRGVEGQRETRNAPNVANTFGQSSFVCVVYFRYNKRGAKNVLIFCTILSIIGSVMYIVGAITNIWVIIISRFVIGFGSGVCLRCWWLCC